MIEFLRAYLYAFLFWSDIPLGALALLMIYNLTGGNWGETTNRFMKVLSESTWLFLILFLPIALGPSKIYSWVDPHSIGNHAYLNIFGFELRAFVYFFCWIFLSLFLTRSKNSLSTSTEKNVSAGGLVLIVLTVTFAATDWQMSIEPAWKSTIYGLLYLSGQSLSAFCFILILNGFYFQQNRSDHKADKKLLRDLGNIFLTLIMIWAYLSFMQYLIIWSGNLPREVPWYAHRTQNGWQWFVLILTVFQFAGPFLFLLFKKFKESSRSLGWLAALVLFIRALDHYWGLMPGFGYKPGNIFFPSLFTLLSLGFVFLFFISRSLWRFKNA